VGITAGDISRDMMCTTSPLLYEAFLSLIAGRKTNQSLPRIL